MLEFVTIKSTGLHKLLLLLRGEKASEHSDMMQNTAYTRWIMSLKRDASKLIDKGSLQITFSMIGFSLSRVKSTCCICNCVYKTQHVEKVHMF